ncbi:diguanylate cyclase [Bowmanella sp. Y26]|uniref:GGDEF domain-containing protein n=1 Tax=Bowmanella yangjiangensis TaxID=2811230 RepID=UPI001BDCEC34|nr:GGDEF domain-containing protein [Bowmanella yangjiangensis]MBT1063518.1 diguanylate cyclase [Bowmanella yangjiangensis]
MASVWPANALMLGMLLRVPQVANPYGWLASASAFVLADLITGSGLFIALILNGANLLSVAAAYWLLSRLSDDMLNLRHPHSILYIMLASAVGGVAAGLVGSLANPYFFRGSMLNGFTFWWVTEVVNYVAILPIFLSASLQQIRSFSFALWGSRRYDWMPALAVGISCFAMFMIGGPGAVAFPVLALLWCALTYSVFSTSVLTLICSLLALLILSDSKYHHIIAGVDDAALFSIRLGAAVVAVAPIMLAVLTRNRNELMEQLRYLSNYDALTGIRSRAAFCLEASRSLKENQCAHAVMMVDLDHFKQINDQYGHAAGDQTLQTMAMRIQQCLRPSDYLGRMGGEEFAVLLTDCQPIAAKAVAERICAVVASQPVELAGNIPLQVTTSIGVSFAERDENVSLETLLASADAALYESKKAGRNRVTCCSSTTFGAALEPS